MQETDQHNHTSEQQQSRSESPAATTDPETLATAVRVQVEYYFSKENLRTDTFLQSKMDANSAVPLATVMAFPKILALTRDTQVVIKSLESSSVVVLVDGKIKPKGSGRSTIILREIPSESSEESIREIFNYPGARAISSIRSEIGDTWFVTMESEEDAKDTIMDLKLKKRSFNGTPVKARLKTDPGLRSYYTAGTVLPIAYPGMTFQPYGMVMDPQGGAVAPYSYDTTASGSPSSPQSKDKSVAAGGAGGYRKDGSDGDDAGRRDGRDRGANRNNPKGHHTNSTGGTGPNRKQGGGNGKGPGGRDRKENAAAPPPPPPTIEINSAADFPPLAPPGHSADHDHTSLPTTFSGVLSQQQAAVASSSEPVVIPPCGYQGPYVRYSIDDILLIVAGIKDAKIPSTIQLAEHSAALVTSPNTDLLLRQRTFSIDETREQMQLGRPVQREAVITGAVDYGSFIYGELDNSGHGDGEKKSSVGSKAAAASGGGSWAGVLMKGGAPAPQTDSKSSVGTPAKAPAASADKTAAASTPATGGKGEKKGSEKKGGGKSQEGGGAKKEGAKASGGGGAGGDGEGKKNRRRRAGSHGEGKPAATAEEGDNSVAVPSSWGGRPTFANVLKQQEEAAEAAAAGTPSNPAPTASAAPAPASKKPAASQHPNPSGNRPQGGGHKNQDKGGAPKSQSPAGGASGAAAGAASKKLMTNPDGTWVRDKLPPR